MAKGSSNPYTLGEMREALTYLTYLPDSVPIKISGEGPDVYFISTESGATYDATGQRFMGITHIEIRGK